MKNTSLTPAAFSTRKRILALLVAMLLLSTMLPVSAIGLDSPEKAEPAWTAEEIAGTFHVSEENITQLQEDDNGHTLFVLDEYTFVCAPNGARAAAVTYTADYPIALVLPCTGNGVMLGSALPYVDSPDLEMSWDGTYEFLDYDTGEVTPVKDANAFYVENADAPVALASYTTTINGKAIPHPDYNPNGTAKVFWQEEAYTSVNLGESGIQCHGFALFIFDYLFNGIGSRTYTGGSVVANQSFITAQPYGTLMQTPSHTLIMVGFNSSGMYVYHANWTLVEAERNIVALEHFTWAKCTESFVKFNMYITPTEHYIPRWVKKDSEKHSGYCTTCRKTFERAHYSDVAGTNVKCKECGYVGSMGGMTRSTVNP